jgi:Calcium binding
MAQKAKPTKTFKKVDEEREDRIAFEIVVDAYNEDEVAMGWYCYLQDHIAFPFTARCSERIGTTILDEGEKVTVLEIAEEEECEEEIYVAVKWKRQLLNIPLSQIVEADTDDDSIQAIEDWHYWVEQGHQFR